MNATRESLIKSGMVKPESGIPHPHLTRPSPRAVKRVMSRVNAIIARRALVRTK